MRPNSSGSDQPIAAVVTQATAADDDFTGDDDDALSTGNVWIAIQIWEW